MDLKRILNHAEDTAEQRPHKRQSQSPSSVHPPSSPDVYELSSQPGSASAPNMGQLYSYFDNQSSPSASPSPSLGAHDIPKSDNDGNYTYHQEPTIPDDSAFDPSLLENVDRELGGVPLTGHDHLDGLDIQDDSLPTAPFTDDPPAYDTVVPQNSPPPPPAFLTNPDTRLTDLSDIERQQYYEALWANNEIELKDLAQPKLHSQYPQFSDEILLAYFTHTTIITKVWSNYDSPERQFFWHPRNRFNDCGKLHLTPNQRRRLNTLDLETLQMLHVRFDIGTPFRTLFKVHLRSVKNESSAVYRLDSEGYWENDPHAPHGDLEEVIKEGVKNSREDGLPEGQVGLRLKDLDEIAKDFVLRENCAKRQEMVQSNKWFYD
ncbi:hypothetical protein M409DRAFT_48862 [Zasmidium cellare ATCC 36951]|uniref:Uncharacterized protein n=1 Tax=Zasmidium cellare ATCC 36951 TaxID=1080233 RepID=A0A6A6D713_ZASCE|nr:uncharacterized protein M409DRAFT_48862 [Zasmidium cellare ATCC 36951]KAF2173959.1 hypothetical protein M409DRAFT_48862 [Zasmidium cellare ATCC 36951]